MMMKKFLRLLSTAAAGIVAFSVLPKLPEAEVTAADPDRYTVLVLDTSGSMSGTPMIKEREAAEKFCNDILSANGTNYVALVTLNTSSRVVTPFTTDINTISDDIAALRASGGTNYGSALDTAGSLLESVDSSNIRNIVFCSDGLPEHGETQYTGRYNSSDSSSYAYANVAYDKAAELKNDYNIYTLGFFHSLSGSKLDFGRRLMADLASSASQYYDVTDPDQLLFTFGDVAQTVLTNDTDPIILIPGIMGSRLFLNEQCTEDACAWPPNGSKYGNAIWTNVDENMSGELYARPAARQNDLSEFSREYGAQECMKALVDGLCDKYGNTRDIYVFSYDWRQSNTISAVELKNFIDSLNVNKVDIVAHSMGGLVTSKYYVSYGGDKLDKVITCGTPYEGSPHLFEAVETNNVVANGGFSDVVLSLLGLDREIKRSFSGVAELTPTRKYCTYWPMIERVFDYNNLIDVDSDMSESRYNEMLGIEFGTQKAEHAVEFQESIRDASDYNVLKNYENAYFVMGDGQRTVSKTIMYYDELRGGDFIHGFIPGFWISDLEYTNKGDGTVPYLSASMMGQLLFMPNGRTYTVNDTHVGMLSNSETIDFVENILDAQVPALQPAPPTYSPYTVIRIACPVDVEISDGNGSLSSVKGSESFSSSFGRLDLIGKDNEIKMICMDEDTNLDVNLTGTGTGTMNYTIRHYSADDELLDERTFENVPITDKTIIKTKADNSEATVLSVDNNGDGIVDDTWTAKKREDVTVPDSERIAMTGINATIDTAELSADGTAKITVTKDPENTTDNMTVSFSSSDENVATVDANGAVKAVGAGNATITVTSSNGFTKEIAVSVKAASTTSTTTTTTSTATTTTTAAKTTANSSNSPKTGDTTPVTAYVITAFAFGIGAVLARRSRKED